jgi:bifunctional non-homologous end joining protein LigD
MALQEYKKKRTFNTTPEPAGGKSSGKQLHFVIQKHDASRLHYDFRLELKGVLKSWAVPKGPSMNPADKRLAMMVEDHPYDYKDFEGIIPEGNYGAGTVIVWDQGTYEPIEEFKELKEKEKHLTEALKKGQIKIKMNGTKLKGEFVLVKTPKRAANAWLLIKHRDKFATDEDITLEDKSVLSGKTIAQVEIGSSSKSTAKRATGKKASSDEVKAPKRTRKTMTPEAPKKKSSKSRRVTDIVEKISGKVKATMPKDVMPMLATLSGEPAGDEGWYYEIKWDGFRAIAYLEGETVELRSRNNKVFNEKFYPVTNALKEMDINAVIDGEVIVLNDKGLPDFSALQTWRSEADGNLIFYAFDLLWYDGYDLTNVPFRDRKELLNAIIPTEGIIRFSENFEIDGKEFFKMADDMGLEGIIAKKGDSVYAPGIRSKEWLKIKTQKQQDVVIAGYSRNENSSRKLSALLLGVYDHGELNFIGSVGTGFSAKMQQEIIQRLKPLETEKCPFREVPDYNKPSRFRPDPPNAEVTWVKPEIVAEVSYRTVAGDGTLRHPSFKGIRDDKSPQEAVPESLPADRNEAVKKSGREKFISPVSSKERKTLLNPSDEQQVRSVGGHELKFTNLSKIYWPESGISKRDMLNYYYQVAPIMLPYMKDRPQTLNRFPNGITGQSFYQKDVTGKVPAWMGTYKYHSEGDQRDKNFLVCTNEESLLYIASLGCIEMNPWSSRTQSPDNPDWCIIDLDPDKNAFNEVIETARVTFQVLDAAGIPSYCKTSGSTGLHIYIPLGAKYSYEESKEFGRVIAKIVHAQLPKFTSIERPTAMRKGKIYIDFLQNRPQATVAGPYSLRPKPGAPVSMPLPWDEVKKGLKMTDFNITNAMSRLKEYGDIFSGVLQKGIDRQKALTNLEKLYHVKEVA